MSLPPQYNQGQYPPADQKQQTQQTYMQPPMPQQPQVAVPHPGMAPQQPSSAAQIGEQYRAQLVAQCAQGIHDRTTKYGTFGIIMAVACFPCGLICLFSDKEERCTRCGVKLG